MATGLDEAWIEEVVSQLLEAARVTIKTLAENDDALIIAVQQPEHFREQLVSGAAPAPDNAHGDMAALYGRIFDCVAEEFLILAPWSANFDRVALADLLRCFPALTDQVAQLERTMNVRFDSVDGALRKVDANAAAYHKDLKDELDSIHDDLRNKTTNSRPTELEDEVWGSRPAKLKHWLERDPTSNGTTLHDTIFSSPSSQRGSRCVLVGRAGSGKTSLAASIASRCESDTWSLVAWIDASTRSNIESALIALGEAILGTHTNVLQEQRLRIEQVLASFKRFGKNNCLFVYDNAEGLDYLDGVLPVGPGVHIVVTTRRKNGWSNQAGWIMFDIGNFSRAESIKHLLSVTEDIDLETADKIASYLGDLPLAVTQAAATCSRYYSNLQDYYTDLQATNGEELLEPVEGGNYSKGTIASLQLATHSALNFMKDPLVKKEAEDILAVLCYLAESGVPTKWLKYNNGLPSRKASKLLQDASIIDQSNDGRITSIHRLLAHALRTSHDSRIAHEGTLITSHFLDKINRTQHDEDINTLSHPRQITYQLINQFSTLCSQSYSKALFDYPQVQQCLFDTLNIAIHSDLHSEAFRLAQAFSITERAIGASHPQIVRARDDLALAHFMASQYKIAASLAQVTITHFLNTLGPAHLDTIRARDELALTYQFAGQYADAIAVHKAIIADLTNILDPQHPDTIRARENLASTYHRAGQYADAITVHKEIIAQLTSTLGPEHPDTITALTQAVSTFRFSAPDANVTTFIEEIVANLTNILGPEDPDTIEARDELARTYQRAGQYADAIAVHKEIIAQLTSTRGPVHPDTIEARDELARTYHRAGQYADAIAEHEDIIADLTNTHGPQHPDTIRARNQLASVYCLEKQYADAITMYQDIIADLTNTHDPQHPDTIKDRNELARTYQRAEQYAKAIAIFEATLADCITGLGRDNSLTKTVRENLEAAKRELERQEDDSAAE